MENADRETIEVNIRELIRATDYKTLRDCCLEGNVILFSEMTEKIERIHVSELDRHSALFHKITTRGPTAFKALIQICTRQFPDAARLLGQEISINKTLRPRTTTTTTTTTAAATRELSIDTRDGGDNNKLAVFDEQLPPATAFKKVRFSTKFHGNGPTDIPSYYMQSRDRGVVLLVNIIDFRNRPKVPRAGARVDKVNMVHLFREMGFTVFYYENRTANELRSLLQELCQSDWLRTTNCFVMALMTHGNMVNEVAKVEFCDSSFLDLNEVLGYFSNDRCKALLNKPKVFLFPFCRGEQPERSLNHKQMLKSASATADPYIVAVQSDAADMGGAAGGESVSPIPTVSDTKICYASGPGFEAMRDPNTGSWYIESMCKIWAEYAHDKSLDDLLKMVGEAQLERQSTDGYIQTAHNEDRGFFKKLYFNPGYYGEEQVRTTQP